MACAVCRGVTCRGQEQRHVHIPCPPLPQCAYPLNTEAAIAGDLILVKVAKIIDYHIGRLDQNNKPEGSAILGCQKGTEDHHFCPISLMRAS